MGIPSLGSSVFDMNTPAPLIIPGVIRSTSTKLGVRIYTDIALPFHRPIQPRGSSNQQDNIHHAAEEPIDREADPVPYRDQYPVMVQAAEKVIAAGKEAAL